ncbi:MAG: hypothetical protein RL367_1084 [Pseudomonadota bacterium]|jgi:uncharacterized protein (DUF2141 family)
MKRFIPLCVTTLFLVVATPAMAGDVTVILNGVQASDQDVMIGLQTRDEFLQPKGHYGAIIHHPKAGSQTVVIKDVPDGDYSISVWHDVNGNHQFDKAANGRPLDGWSMINAAALRAAPQWDLVKFAVPAAGKTVALDMIYAQ